MLRWRPAALPLLLACLAGAACGKKGPPLPPLVRIPAAVATIEARRVGPDVYVTLTVPSQNVDGATPANVNRVDVFAVTADVPPTALAWLQLAPIARIRVAPPPDPDAAPGARADAEASYDTTQGGTVTLRETLPPEPPSAPDASPRSRFYTAFAFGDRARASLPSTVAAVPLAPLPEAPAGLVLTHDAERITATWKPSEGAAGYNVYRSDEPPPTDTAEAASALGVSLPSPVNDAPLTAASFSDALQLGRERCYVVRAVGTSPEQSRGPAGASAVESAPSRRECITPVDRYAPAAPTGLSVVSRDDGGIELRWTANSEADLAGYLVLRGTAGDATLRQITEAPVTQARFIDRDVKPGVLYVYAVVAVDTWTPVPNRSPESARDEVMAR